MVWSFTGKTLTTWIDGVKELNAAAFDTTACTLDRFAIGSSSAGKFRLGALWIFISSTRSAEFKAISRGTS